MDPSSPLIRSRSNPLVKRIRALKGQSRGGDTSLCLIEGIKLLEEAVAAGVQIVEAVASLRLGRSERGRLVLRTLRARGVAVRWLDEKILDSLSEVETTQGILALARGPSFEEVQVFGSDALVVVAIGIQNPGNLGGLLRTAEAAGATGVYLTKGTADPFSWKALRGSMGSAFRLPHVRGPSAEVVALRLRARGIRTVAAVADGAMRYDEADLREPLAFLLGSEGAGLPPEVASQADLRVAIPMRGGVESLNVGVAAGILLFEAARQRRR